jgi:hypothetical protein
MRKVFMSALMIATMFSIGMAQDNASSQSREEIAKFARAPIEAEGIGRAAVFVSDVNGDPVKGAYATLESTWGRDNFCESFGWTNNNGAIALLPIHMGTLKLIVKAKGFETSKIDVTASSLSQPVRVTMVPKK